MGMEDIVSEASDFFGDFAEGALDKLIDVGDYAKDMAEDLGNEGMEALENGDLDGAVECLDMSQEEKDGIKEVFSILDLDKGKMISGGMKMTAGLLGTVVALATPGIQVAGFASFSTAVKGALEIKEALPSKTEDVPAYA